MTIVGELPEVHAKKFKLYFTVQFNESTYNSILFIDLGFGLRASIWWKYLDEDSVLPPPYTLVYFIHQCTCHLAELAKTAWSQFAGRSERKDDANADIENERCHEKKASFDYSIGSHKNCISV